MHDFEIKPVGKRLEFGGSSPLIFKQILLRTPREIFNDIHPEIEMVGPLPGNPMVPMCLEKSTRVVTADLEVRAPTQKSDERGTHHLGPTKSPKMAMT